MAIRRLLSLHEENKSALSAVTEDEDSCSTGEQESSPPADNSNRKHVATTMNDVRAGCGGGVHEGCLRLESWLHDVFIGSASNMLMVVGAVGLFWSIFFVDIVGDVYGPTAGGLVVLVPIVGCVGLCVGLMSWLQQPAHVQAVD